MIQMVLAFQNLIFIFSEIGLRMAFECDFSASVVTDAEGMTRLTSALAQKKSISIDHI